MIFLIEYDRKNGKLVKMETYIDSERQKVDDARLALELNLFRRGISHEVVTLEALSEAVIRTTHRRYFETLEQLATLPLSQ